MKTLNELQADGFSWKGVKFQCTCANSYEYTFTSLDLYAFTIILKFSKESSTSLAKCEASIERGTAHFAYTFVSEKPEEPESVLTKGVNTLFGNMRSDASYISKLHDYVLGGIFLNK